MRLQCVDVNNPLQTVFKYVYKVYTYSDCMIDQLSYNYYYMTNDFAAK